MVADSIPLPGRGAGDCVRAAPAGHGALPLQPALVVGVEKVPGDSGPKGRRLGLSCDGPAICDCDSLAVCDGPQFDSLRQSTVCDGGQSHSCDGDNLAVNHSVTVCDCNSDSPSLSQCDSFATCEVILWQSV